MRVLLLILLCAILSGCCSLPPARLELGATYTPATPPQFTAILRYP